MSNTQPVPNSSTAEAQTPRLEDVAAELGPFAPPPDYAFEPELIPQAPRSVPALLRRGPAAIRDRRNLTTLFAAGVACLLFDRTRMVQELSYYVLPLGYLLWIGCALIAIAAVGAVLRRFGVVNSPWAKYLRNGAPVVARVLVNDIYITRRQVHGSTISRFGFNTGVELILPETGRRACCWIHSDEIGDAGKRKRFAAPLEPGEYVTAVYFPGAFETTARIYRLLGASPDVPFIQKDGRTWQPGVTLHTAGLCFVGICSILALLLGGFYAVTFRFPIDEAFGRAAKMGAAPAVVLLVVFAWLLRRVLLREKASAGEPAKPVTLWFVSIGGGAFGALFGTLILIAFANSGLDKSPPQYRDIEVINLWQTTHDGIFRDYEIEYRELPGGTQRRYPARAPELAEFDLLRLGVIEVHAGRLGLPWISRACPAMLVFTEGPPRADGTLAVVSEDQVQEPAPGKTLKAEVAIALGEDKFVPVSPLLKDIIRQRIKQSREERSASSRPASTRPS